MELFEEFRNLIAALEEKQIEYAVCGGLAMSVYAFPRATLDIDLLLESQSLKDIQAIARELGFDQEAERMQFKSGAIEIHRLAKIEAGEDLPMVLDLLLVTPELETVWKERRRISWEKGELSVVSPKGLIHLKTLRGSGQDQDDITHLRSITHEA